MHVSRLCGCTVRAQTCRASGCSVFTPRRLSGSLSPGQPKLVLKLSKIFTNCQTVKNARSSNFSSSNCCGANLLTRTMATKRQVSLRQFIELPPCSRLDCIVIFINSFERFFFSLSYLLVSRSGSLFLLGPCHFFVV